MRLKAFSIFCLSFLVMFTLTSCDNENLVNEEELNFSDENPAITVLAEQKAGNDGYDEKGFSIVNCLNSLELHKLYSGLKLNFQLSGVTKIELESVDGYALSGTVGIQWDETGQPVIGEAENASSILVFKRLLYFHLALRPLRRIPAFHLQGRTGCPLFRSASDCRTGHIHKPR